MRFAKLNTLARAMLPQHPPAMTGTQSTGTAAPGGAPGSTSGGLDACASSRGDAQVAALHEASTSEGRPCTHTHRVRLHILAHTARILKRVHASWVVRGCARLCNASWRVHACVTTRVCPHVHVHG
jgi:hypothetical protein